MKATKEIQEMVEKAIQRIVFDYTNKFGIRNLDGEAAYSASLKAYKSLFGKETFDYILKEAERKFNESK